MISDVPPEVDCGADLKLTVDVSCPSGCDLRRGLVRVVAPDGEILAVELARFDGTANATEDLVVAAPPEVGEHCWTIAFEGAESCESPHEPSSRSVRFRTKPHGTSIAVWDAPTPVAVHSPFPVKVGVKCSAGCRLTGQVVRVSDEAGSCVAEGRLGEAPWPGTRGLYVAELNLPETTTERVFHWTCSFSGNGLALPHESGSSLFSFRTAGAPEHIVVVEVKERDAGAPLEGVGVFMGMYHATTDARGRAELKLPKGAYPLVARRRGFQGPSLSVAVDGERTFAIPMDLVPESDPDEEEVWM
jgi:hypothetical protein